MKLESFVQSKIRALELPAECEPLLNDVFFMATYKYDDYELYRPGRRFLQHLLEWLGQFSASERPVMLKLLTKMIFISEAEMQALAQMMFRRMKHELLDYITVNEQLGPFDYYHAHNYFLDYLKKCVFIGMGDGSRIDYFRRHSAILPRDAVIEYYKLDEEEKRQHHDKEFFFLVDDFCGSGTTFIRKQEDSSGVFRLEGQLKRFLERWSNFVNLRKVYYCPYIITESAHQRIRKLVDDNSASLNLHADFKILQSLMIPKDHSCVFSPSHILNDHELTQIRNVCDKYYSKFKEDENIRKGDPTHGARYGYGSTGLAITLYHNCPNNCLYLIWHDFDGWKPLFPRISKHR